MAATSDIGSEAAFGVPPVVLSRPSAGAERPLLLSSPHSGAHYPKAFVQASRLDPLTLRRSEDAFVDEIVAVAPDLGAALVRANFPRAYCDPNREAFELDPAMFDGVLPDYVNVTSRRALLGLGTVARLVAAGANIYPRPIPFTEAETRIAQCWFPYHATLATELERLRSHHGFAILIDCHSMPSVGGPHDRDPGAARPDIVLGDRFGLSCPPELTRFTERYLLESGLRVARNMPFAGGFITEHYGQPVQHVYALQIEINRALYMDEDRITPRPGLPRLAKIMSGLVAALGNAAGPIHASRIAVAAQ